MAEKNTDEAEPHGRRQQLLLAFFADLRRNNAKRSISDQRGQCHKRRQIEAIAQSKSQKSEKNENDDRMPNQGQPQIATASPCPPVAASNTIVFSTAYEAGAAAGCCQYRREAPGRRRPFTAAQLRGRAVRQTQSPGSSQTRVDPENLRIPGIGNHIEERGMADAELSAIHKGDIIVSAQCRDQSGRRSA